MRGLRLGAVVAVVATVGIAATEAPADLVFTGGAVYKVDAARSWASAVAIRGGRIVYVGDDAGARAFAGPATRVVALGGRMLLPGFHDSHVHLLGGGVARSTCDLAPASSPADAVARVASFAAAHPADPWVRGHGWELPLFPAANPDKRLLDAVLPDRPAYLLSADGHSAWVNSKALALAGVGAATPDPAAGRIERDPATGEPSGTLRESAKELVQRLVPPPTAEQWRAGLVDAVGIAHRFGIVGALEAHVDAQQAAVFRDLDRAGELGLHVTLAWQLDSNRDAEQIADFVRWRGEMRSAHVAATAAKLFADGVIEAGTAALLEPYVGREGREGREGSRGELRWNEERLRAIALALDRAGFQIHVHAIGDRAIRATLDALAAVEAENGARDRRPTLAHLELFAPSDIPRFRRLGAVASFQPLWAYEDEYIRDLTLPFLDPERSRWLYPIGSVARAGAVVAGGSDWPVSSLNPLEAIEVALTRRDPAAAAGPAWIPEEQVDLATMLAAYTIGSAWASFREHETGSIEPGKLADLVVLDRNLFEIPPTAISDAKVLLTLFEGEEVWRDPSFTSTLP